MSIDKQRLDRRQFLKASGSAAALLTVGMPLRHVRASHKERTGRAASKHKMIILSFDGMDPQLTESMMAAGQLPHFDRLRQKGGYRRLGTSIPAQTPVAFGNFIVGAGPGTHGIFDFIHRLPEKQYSPFFAASTTDPGSGYWGIGDHRLQLGFWPFNHIPPQTELLRKGVPFWEYFDQAGIPSCFYALPSNYPPSQSKHGHHRSVAGLGTPDMLGSYGTYQYFASDGPYQPQTEPGGRRSRLYFKNDSATGFLIGPYNTFLKKPKPTKIKFQAYRDGQANAALIEIQSHQLLLKQGQWSDWIKLDFALGMPSFLPDEHLGAICRFYLLEVAPELRLYVTPINIDPSNPAVRISSPEAFIREISDELGLFYTAGFQEDHKALSNGVFTDEDYVKQTDIVLQERIKQLDYALEHYQDGLLFFYFACTDLQAHMFWWDSDEPHPIRTPEAARHYHKHVKELYRKMDRVMGQVLARYGSEATIMAFSDHGFANFRRQFNLNTWLRDNGYVGPTRCTSLLTDVDWSQTRAYGLGINGLYINQKGRERDGIVDPDRERDQLLNELLEKLEAVKDVNGRQVIQKVYRTDKEYSGPETQLAPDLVIGYSRDYRSSWATGLGDMTEDVLLDNKEAWSASHCMATAAVPGVLFCNRPVRAEAPQLIDLAPSILEAFGLAKPASMIGQNVLMT